MQTAMRERYHMIDARVSASCDYVLSFLLIIIPVAFFSAEIAPASVSLEDLASETFILMDEGAEYNTALSGFARRGLTPNVGYEVYDDYTIMSMIRQGLGVSLLFRRVVRGFSKGVAIRELDETLTRPVCLAWKNRETLPIAARSFADYILERIAKKEQLEFEKK